MNSVIGIKVIETPVLVMDLGDEVWKIVPGFNIKVETEQYILYIVRYVPDFHYFDQLIKMHYHKIKFSLPKLKSISKVEKRLSIRTLFHGSLKPKTNAEKVEKYLHRCSMHPILKYSSLLNDFFSPQRENDFKTLQLQRHDDSFRSTSPANFHDNSNDGDANSYNLNGSISFLPLPAIQESISDIQDNQDNHRSVEIADTYCNPRRSNDIHDIFWRNSRTTASEHEFPKISTRVAESKKTDDFQNTSFNYQSEFLLDNFEMIKVLGRGCMGKVLLVKSKSTMRYYALKSIIKDHVVEQREITHTLDEQDILSSLSQINHPFLTRLHASFQDEYRLYLLTDYYCGGDLATHMARQYSFPKNRALIYAAEIIEGIGELHSLGILYRDLKPENILLTRNGHIVLTDFGLSKYLTESNRYTTQTFCGTAEYLAPEVLLGEEYSFGVGHWSFGTILFEMLAGIPPFWADNHTDMYRRILEDPLEFSNDITDFETTDFLVCILDKDPTSRLGANGIDEIKSHPFFADISWSDLSNLQIESSNIPIIEGDLDFSNFDPEFLTMDPVFTPAPSEINLILELKDIFNGYSFLNDKFAEEELNNDYIKQMSVNDNKTSSRRDEEYLLEDLDSTLVSRPSRKRGSFSMLSDKEETNAENSYKNTLKKNLRLLMVF